VTRRAASYDAVVVGAGPNGLTAAARLASAGAKVLVLERDEHPGGGTRSAELLVPGVVQDVCSAVHPFGVASPAFRALALEEHGLRWSHPPIALAHPLDDGDAVLLHRSLEDTATGLDGDADAYCRLVAPLLARWDDLLPALLGPVLAVPPHPVALGRFGLAGVLPITVLARRFRTPRARALLAGLAAHSIQPLTTPLTGALGLSLALAAHASGWPFAEGGSQAIADALGKAIASNGGELVTDHDVAGLDELPSTTVTLLDVTPSQLVAMSEGRLAGWAGRAYRRFRHGPGACKVDYVLSGPMPWTSAEARQAGTLHLGGDLRELVASERAPSKGQIPEQPFVLVTQPTVADSTRAPAGTHVLWAYCHVPPGSPFDASARIDAQLDRFAPGWRDLIVARGVRRAVDLERYNPNYVGGDIVGGAMSPRQIVARPRLSLRPYDTPLPGVLLCSASTPPGGAVHGMCGWHAAGRAIELLGG
jgi:phytoene dehydrogenase-like protein